jgi:hypothetical protein
MKRAAAVVLGFLVFVSTSAFADGIHIQATTISSIRVDITGHVIVVFDTASALKAPCGSNDGKTIGFDSTSNGGKTVYSLLVSAKLSGKPIEVFGDGTCVNYQGTTFEGWSAGIMK